jgi:hypothetical protein
MALQQALERQKLEVQELKQKLELLTLQLKACQDKGVNEGGVNNGDEKDVAEEAAAVAAAVRDKRALTPETATEPEPGTTATIDSDSQSTQSPYCALLPPAHSIDIGILEFLLASRSLGHRSMSRINVSYCMTLRLNCCTLSVQILGWLVVRCHYHMIGCQFRRSSRCCTIDICISHNNRALPK